MMMMLMIQMMATMMMMTNTIQYSIQFPTNENPFEIELYSFEKVHKIFGNAYSLTHRMTEYAIHIFHYYCHQTFVIYYFSTKNFLSFDLLRVSSHPFERKFKIDMLFVCCNLKYVVHLHNKGSAHTHTQMYIKIALQCC